MASRRSRRPSWSAPPADADANAPCDADDDEPAAVVEAESLVAASSIADIVPRTWPSAGPTQRLPHAQPATRKAGAVNAPLPRERARRRLASGERLGGQRGKRSGPTKAEWPARCPLAAAERAGAHARSICLHRNAPLRYAHFAASHDARGALVLSTVAGDLTASCGVPPALLAHRLNHGERRALRLEGRTGRASAVFLPLALSLCCSHGCAGSLHALRLPPAQLISNHHVPREGCGAGRRRRPSNEILQLIPSLEFNAAPH